MGIEPARPCRVRSPWALTAGGYREGQSGALGPGAIPDILGLHCGHRLTRSGHGGISRVLFRVSEEQQKHLGETYRPGRGASERGSSPASGPSYSGQTRPNTRGDRQRRRGGLCPVSALLPVPGGFDRASPRWAVQSSAPNHPKDSPSLDLHLQGPPCHLGRLRRDAHMRSDGNSHPLLNYPLIGLFLRYI